MKCLISAQGFANVEWYRELRDDVVAETVLGAFCDRYSLSSGDCQLLQADKPLQAQQPLLQVHDEAAGVLQLAVSIKPTIAFVVWYNFRQLRACNEEHLSIVWHTMLQAFCRRQITNVHLLSLLKASPLAFPGANQDLQPLLLLQQMLVMSHATVPVSSKAQKAQLQSKTAPAQFAWGGLGGAQGPESARLQATQLLGLALLERSPAADASRVEYIHCAVMLVHMLSLLRGVSVGAGPCEKALWLTLTGVAHYLELQEPARDPQTPDKLDPDGREEAQLAKQLVNLLMSFLRSAVRGTGPRAILCLDLLSGLMKSASPTVFQAVSSELLSLGIITPLAAAFDNSRHIGEAALKVLCSLVNRRHLPKEQVDATENLLASVRGVLRCSNMLCPVYDYSQEEPCPSLQSAAHVYNIQWIIPGQGALAPFGCMEAAALIMNSMLKTRPFWQRPASDMSATNSRVAPKLCREVCPDGDYSYYLAEPTWPTPTASAWQDIQVLAARLVTTLTWLNTSQREFVLQTGSGHRTLNKILVTLLNNLVAGHLRDPSLDTEEIHKVVHEAVLSSWSPLAKLQFPPLLYLQSVVVDVMVTVAVDTMREAETAHLAGLDLQDASMDSPAACPVASKLNPNALVFKPESNDKKGKQKICQNRA